jgi:archaellum component FlaG (FlaF/FlaG flagellin family)
MKPEKIREKFKNDFKIINMSKTIRQFRTEEYFLPQLYVTSEEKNTGMFKYNNTKNSKNIMFATNLSNNKTINEEKNDDDNIKLLNIGKIFKKDIKIGNMIIHNTFNINLKKRKFIENIFKELTKIPNVELLSDNDDIQKISNLKNLINKLLLRPELTNNDIRIKIKFSYYYDKLFYFININDENKSHKIMQNQLYNKSSILVKNERNDPYKIPLNIESKKTRNKINRIKFNENNKNEEDFILKNLKNESQSNEIIEKKK